MATRRDLTAFVDSLTSGARLVCTENTYRASKGFEPNSEVFVVDRPGKTSIRLRNEAGSPFWMTPPSRARDVLTLSSGEIRYLLPERRWHTVTWRVLGAGTTHPSAQDRPSPAGLWWVFIERDDGHITWVGPYPDADAAEVAMNESALVQGEVETDCIEAWFGEGRPADAQDLIVVDLDEPDCTGVSQDGPR